MENIKLILMRNGRVELDFMYKGDKPKINEIITIETKDIGYLNYKVESIQHFFDYKLEFKYLLITAIRED